MNKILEMLCKQNNKREEEMNRKDAITIPFTQEDIDEILSYNNHDGAETVKASIEEGFERMDKKDEYLRDYIKTPVLEGVSREGKLVYVRPDYHERIVRIVGVIGEGRVNISTYLNNVLYEHFEKYDGCVDTLFKKRFEEILTTNKKD